MHTNKEKGDVPVVNANLLELYSGKIKHFRVYLARRRKWLLLWRQAEESFQVGGQP